jgi:hypothetical protein
MPADRPQRPRDPIPVAASRGAKRRRSRAHPSLTSVVADDIAKVQRSAKTQESLKPSWTTLNWGVAFSTSFCYP